MKRIARSLFTQFLFFSFFFSAQAQVSVDGTSRTLITSPTQSFSFSHTCSGNQRVLFVSVACSNGTNPLIALARYGGRTMSLLWSSSSGTESQMVWMLKNPPTGINAVSVYLPFSPNIITASGVSFTGVDTTNPVGTNAGLIDFNDTCSIQLNTGFNNSLLVFFAETPSCGSADSLVFGSAQTPLIVLDNINGPEAACSVMPAPFAGSYTVLESGHCTSGGVFGFVAEVKSADVSASYQETKTESNITLYPNPSDGYVNIGTSSYIEQGRVTVVDIAGKEIYWNEFSGTTKLLDFSALKSGVYFLRLSTRSGIIERKFVRM